MKEYAMAKPAGKIRIIITDDHKLYRIGLRTSFEKWPELEVIGEAENGLQLMNMLKHHQPDFITLGISMPVMDGLATLPEIKKHYPGIKVIMISMHTDPGVICKMVELGANSYLNKARGSIEIHEAIIQCHKYWFFLSEDIRRSIIAIHATIPPKEGPAQRTHAMLNNNEKMIIRLLSEKKSITDIAQAVALNTRTVEALIDRLKKNKII